MKEVLIISFWNPTKTTPGKGVFIHDQVHALMQIRSEITFLEVNILPGRSLLRKEIKIKDLNGNKIATVNFYSVFWKAVYINPWIVYVLLTGLLKRSGIRPSLIHSNVIFPCGIVGYLFAKKFSCPHIISEHWSRAEKFIKHPVFGRSALKVYRNSLAILCVSDFLAEKITSSTGCRQISIIPNIIDTEVFRFVPKQPHDSLTFACVATWKKPKRLDLIIDSLSEFANQKKRIIILCVVGEGEQKENFRNISHEYLSIQWYGHVSKNEIAKILQNSDFFMHASEVETFSIVTVEALATGTPVLASGTGALPELINDTNGLLVDNTLDAWIDGLRNITVRKFDPEVISGAVADKYSPVSVAKKIEQVYEASIQSDK